MRKHQTLRRRLLTMLISSCRNATILIRSIQEVLQHKMNKELSRIYLKKK